jgi:hypothetical protein
MSYVVVNASIGRARKVTRGGRSYWVAPVTMIVPGVLKGSQGPIYYPPEENSRDPAAWNHMPVVVYHPQTGGRPVSARDPDVLEKQQVGYVFGSTIANDGRLKGEAWIDEEWAREKDKRVLEALEGGRPMEVSTGLFLDQEPAAENSRDARGRPYDYTARNYRPDHLALLPDQKGACSIDDGCGLMVNSAGEEYFTTANCGGPGGKPGPCPTAGPGSGAGKGHQIASMYHRSKELTDAEEAQAHEMIRSASKEDLHAAAHAMGFPNLATRGLGTKKIAEQLSGFLKARRGAAIRTKLLDNTTGPRFNVEEYITPAKKKCKCAAAAGHECACPKKGVAPPPETPAGNTWSDKARAAAATARRSKMKPHAEEAASAAAEAVRISASRGATSLDPERARRLKQAHQMSAAAEADSQNAAASGSSARHQDAAVSHMNAATAHRGLGNTAAADAHERARAAHLKAGQITNAFPSTGLAMTPDKACILPGQEIQGRIVVASKARYAGPAVKIRTASGQTLAVTTNHPVLTEAGFTPAGDLREGQNLLRYIGKDESAGPDGDEQNAPTLVEKVFEALLTCGGMQESSRVSSLDFHGDAAFFQGTVQVVRADRSLGECSVSEAAEGFDQGRLARKGERESALAGGCRADEVFRPLLPPSIGTVSGTDDRPSFLVGHPLPAEPSGVGAVTENAGGTEFAVDDSSAKACSHRDSVGRFPREVSLNHYRHDGVGNDDFRSVGTAVEQFRCFGPGAELDTRLHKSKFDSPRANSSLASELLDRFSGKVVLDQVVSIQRFHYDGSVYDFESAPGFILTEKLVVSNCKILKDGTVRGKPLTKKQRGMFGVLCGQRKGPAMNSDWELLDNANPRGCNQFKKCGIGGGGGGSSGAGAGTPGAGVSKTAVASTATAKKASAAATEATKGLVSEGIGGSYHHGETSAKYAVRAAKAGDSATRAAEHGRAAMHHDSTASAHEQIAATFGGIGHPNTERHTKAAKAHRAAAAAHRQAMTVNATSTVNAEVPDDISLDEMMATIMESFRDAHPPEYDPATGMRVKGCDIVQAFPGYVIYREMDRTGSENGSPEVQLYRQEYTWDAEGDDVTFSPEAEPVTRRTTYVPDTNGGSRSPVEPNMDYVSPTGNANPRGCNQYKPCAASAAATAATKAVAKRPYEEGIGGSYHHGETSARSAVKHLQAGNTASAREEHSRAAMHHAATAGAHEERALTLEAVGAHDLAAKHRTAAKAHRGAEKAHRDAAAGMVGNSRDQGGWSYLNLSFATSARN